MKANEASFWKVCKMLWDWRKWKEVKTDFFSFSKIEHDNGCWYFRGLGCSSLHCADENTYYVNAAGYLVFMLLCERLEYKLAKFGKVVEV